MARYKLFWKEIHKARNKEHCEAFEKKALEIIQRNHGITKKTYLEQCKEDGTRPDKDDDADDKNEEVDATQLPDDMSNASAEVEMIWLLVSPLHILVKTIFSI